jgi:hypothetical protein
MKLVMMVQETKQDIILFRDGADLKNKLMGFMVYFFTCGENKQVSHAPGAMLPPAHSLAWHGS